MPTVLRAAAALSIALGSAPSNVAQDAPPLRPVLVGARVVDPLSDGELRRVLMEGQAAEARPVPGRPGRFTLAGRLVDLRERRAPVTLADGSLRSGTGPTWTVPLEELGAPRDLARTDCLLTEHVLFVPLDGGGVVALEAGSGQKRWRREDGPNELLVEAGALLLTAGPVGDGQIELWAQAVRNGARLFAEPIDVERTPEQIVATHHGIAARCADRVVVVDPSGPRRFVYEGEVDEIAGCGSGWVALRDDRVRAWDRDGRERWSTKLQDDDFLERRALHVLPDGDVVVLRWCRISDSGVRVWRLDGDDGAVRFSRSCAPLGVPHSKYRHFAYAQVDHDRIVVVSQASGGSFIEVLDAESGHSLARH